MATSGRIETGRYNYTNFYFQWQFAGNSTAGNYTVINWQAGINITSGAYWYSNAIRIDGGSVNGNGLGNGTWSNISGNGDHQLRGGTITIYHNGDGTKSFGADINGWLYGGGNYYTSGGWDLPTIPRQALLTNLSQDITDEDSAWVEFINPGGFAVNAWFEFPYLTGGTRYLQTNNIGSRFTWALSTSDRNSLRAVLANYPNATIRYVLETNVGGTYMVDYRDRTYSIINANPTFATSNLSYADTNSTITAITTNNQKIVQNLSNFKATWTAATALKGASISSYQITIGTNVQTFSSPQTALDYATLNLSTDTPMSITVTDSRGFQTTATKTITVLPWSPPRATITAARVNNYEDNTEFTANVTIDSVDSKNSIQVLKVRTKKTTDVSYTENTMTTGMVTTVSLDKLFEYNAQIVITDKFGTTTYNLLIPKGTPILFFDTAKLSIGIGMFPTTDESLEIDPGYMTEIMKVINPIGRTITTTVNTNPGTLPQFTGTTWAAHGTVVIDGVTNYYFTRTA